jgi:hypothetical protein
MRNSSLGALLFTGVLIPITSCISSPSLTSIVVSPSVMNFGGPGLTTQLTAVGYYTRPDHAPITKNITNEVDWKSATNDCVTVSGTGVITSGLNICSGIQITASAQGFHGYISGVMVVNVSQSGNASTDVAQVVVTPANPAPVTVGTLAQFSASGFTAAGKLVTLTNPVSWNSSNTGVATIDQTGRATAVAAGSTTITGAYKNPDGASAIPGTAILTVQ